MPVHDPWSSKAKTLSNRTNQGMFLLLVFLFALKKQTNLSHEKKKVVLVPTFLARLRKRAAICITWLLSLAKKRWQSLSRIDTKTDVTLGTSRASYFRCESSPFPLYLVLIFIGHTCFGNDLWPQDLILAWPLMDGTTFIDQTLLIFLFFYLISQSLNWHLVRTCQIPPGPLPTLAHPPLQLGMGQIVVGNNIYGCNTSVDVGWVCVLVCALPSDSAFLQMISFF